MGFSHQHEIQCNPIHVYAEVIVLTGAYSQEGVNRIVASVTLNLALTLAFPGHK